MRWNLALAGLAASWGFIAVLVAAVDLGAEALAFLRLSIAAATLALVAVVTRRLGQLRPGGDLPRLVVLGIVQGAHWLLFFETIKLSSVAFAVLTFYCAPIFIALGAPTFVSETLSNVVLGALLVGGAGIGLIVLSGNDDGRYSIAALATGLGSALTFATLVLLSKRLLSDSVAPLTVAFWDTFVGAIAISPALLLAGRILPDGAGEWGAVLLLGVLFTGLSTLVYALLLQRVTAQVAGILTFLEPVAAVLLAYALLGESLSRTAAIGGVMVLAAGAAVVALDATDAATNAAARVGSGTH